jgi:hypothetical protein
MSATTSPAPAREPRHALGLPAGSIRALLAFGVLGYLWILVLRNPSFNKEVSLAVIYLQFLMILILAHFFTAHGNTIGDKVSKRSPLGLPRGSVRLLLLGGYLGLAAFLYKTQPKFQFPQTGPILLMLLVMISAYFLGHVLTGLMSFLNRGTLPPWFQDIQAWVALLALFLLGIILIVRLVINTELPLEKQLDLPMTETVLGGLVGFYFGARS